MSLLAQLLVGCTTAIVGAVATGVVQRHKSPRSSRSAGRLRLVAVGAACWAVGFVAAVLASRSWGSEQSLTIYSSFPQQHADGGPNKRTDDVEKAIRLALNESDGKADKFTIKYVPLDATDKTGAFSPQKIEENARTAAEDDKTAVYIGDYTSSASIESIPILSRAGVPQISPASTRVGLTVGDSLSDVEEPDKYYGVGSRNFVRIIPNDDVQAAALGALMRKDGCRKVAIIYDGQDYSQGLSVLMGLIKGPRRIFSEDGRPNERSTRYERLARQAKTAGVDCFIYMGADNPNTFEIFNAFASELPDAQLYGTDGVSEDSLTEADGDLGPFATRVKLMVPPRDLTRYSGFQRDFENAYHGDSPDPDAIYGYEAMKLALDAIRESGSGTRADILEQLTSSRERDGLLGAYSIDSKGDTTLIDYDIFTFGQGKSSPKRAARQKILEKSVEDLRQRKE